MNGGKTININLKMNLVIDTNIIISGIITPIGTISKLIFNDLKGSHLVCPNYLLDELINKMDKMINITELSYNEINELIYRFSRRIDFINNDLIESNFQMMSYELVKDIDKKDLLFIALSLKTGYKLWTGDKKLINGLRKKSFLNVIDTSELISHFI